MRATRRPVWLFSPLLALVLLGASTPMSGVLHAWTAPENLAPDLEGRKITFFDDFDRLALGVAPDGVWTPRYGYGGYNDLASRTLPNNREEQIYVDPAFTGEGHAPLELDPFSIKDSVLTITASPAPAEVKPQIWGYGITSGLITTRDSFSQQYGYFEMRAKMPKGQGLWPAFWLLPADGGWPPEIDVVEVLGHEPRTIHQTAHWTRGGRKTERGFHIRGPDSTADFHVFGVEWTADCLRWFVDGRETAHMPTPAQMHQPMYMLVNLAVGGHWPGPADLSALPAQMEVDYVRAYEPLDADKIPIGE